MAVCQFLRSVQRSLESSDISKIILEASSDIFKTAKVKTLSGTFYFKNNLIGIEQLKKMRKVEKTFVEVTQKKWDSLRRHQKILLVVRDLWYFENDPNDLCWF